MKPDAFDTREVGIAEPRVENPDHDSLVLKFDQLEFLLESATKHSAKAGLMGFTKAGADALKIAKAIRAQVLK